MLDLVSGPKQEQKDTDAAVKRKFVGVKFNCCGVYVRIYVNKDGTAYEGRCPKCFKPVTLKIGSGGTSSRFFEAD